MSETRKALSCHSSLITHHSLMIIGKSRKELEKMRAAGQLVGRVLQELRAMVEPGITTLDVDRAAEKMIRDAGALPTFKGYHGFPYSICASVNEQVVHGFPSTYALREGDIISIDVGATLGDLGWAVQAHAEGHGYSVVREYVGHGIGRRMHEDPQIPNYGTPGKGAKIRAGYVFAIEPMVNMGTHHTKTLKDGWTVVTVDGQPSAHVEHTIAVTEQGPEVFTRVGQAAEE